MIDKPNPVKPMPNFKHRIDGDLTDSLDLTDIISGMTCRAIGVLKLLVINQDNGGVVADHIASAALDAAIAEIEDINATIQGYHVAMVAAKNESKGGAK